MKFISFIILISVLFAGAYYLYEHTDIFHNHGFSPDTTMTAQVSSILEGDGFTPLGVKDGLVMFKTETLENLNQRMYDVAYKVFNLSHNSLKMEAYYFDEPVMELDFKGKTDAEFKDLRSPEIKIEYDLSSFDALVYDISVDTTAKARIEYFGTKEYFWKDFLGMCLVMVEDAPNVDTVTLEYVINDSISSLSVPAENVLNVYSGEMSLDDFAESVISSNVNNSIVGKGNVDNNKTCPLSASEAKNKADEAYAILKSYMDKGEGEAPEAQIAYANYKFYRDCNT